MGQRKGLDCNYKHPRNLHDENDRESSRSVRESKLLNTFRFKYVHYLLFEKLEPRQYFNITELYLYDT